MISLRELAELVRAVRAAQRHYFRVRSPEALEESKRLERRLDGAVEEVLHPPAPGLFD